MKLRVAGLIAVVAFALALLPGIACADEGGLDVTGADPSAQSADVSQAGQPSRQAAPDGQAAKAQAGDSKDGSDSREAQAAAADEKVLQSEFALLKSDGWLYRADKKGKALDDGRTWSGGNPLASVKKLFVDADVPTIGLDSKSGCDYSHPAINVVKGSAVLKTRAALAAESDAAASLSSLEAVCFKTGKKGTSACSSIGEGAFAGSPVKEMVNLDKASVAEVGARAFANCTQLVAVVLPDTCAKIGEDAFAGCSSLVDVTLRSKDVVALGSKTVFAGSPLYNPFEDGAHVFVPKAARNDYLGTGRSYSRWQRYATKVASMPSLADARVKVASAEYTGKEVVPDVLVKYGSQELKAGSDYQASFTGNTEAGVAWVKVKGTGKFEGTKKASFGIRKAGNELSVKADTVRPDYYAVCFEDTVVEHPVTAEKASGRVVYELVDGSLDGAISMDDKTGDLTIAKGTPEGTYPVKVKVKAVGDANHRAASKTVEFDIEIDGENTPPSAYKFMAIAQREYDEGIEDGSEHWGDSKYWSTFVNSYQSWCSEFVGWCLIEAGLERGVTMPKNASYAKAYYNFYNDRPDIATIHENDGSYEPQPGDIVLQVKSGNRFWHTEMITWSDGYNYGGISGGSHVVTTSRSLGNKEYYYFITINWDAIAEMAGE